MPRVQHAARLSQRLGIALARRRRGRAAHAGAACQGRLVGRAGGAAAGATRTSSSPRSMRACSARLRRTIRCTGRTAGQRHAGGRDSGTCAAPPDGSCRRSTPSRPGISTDRLAGHRRGRARHRRAPRPSRPGRQAAARLRLRVGRRRRMSSPPRTTATVATPIRPIRATGSRRPTEQAGGFDGRAAMSVTAAGTARRPRRWSRRPPTTASAWPASVATCVCCRCACSASAVASSRMSIAGMYWAAGMAIPSSPPHSARRRESDPAKVLNLSLGSTGDRAQQRCTETAVSARHRGGVERGGVGGQRRRARRWANLPTAPERSASAGCVTSAPRSGSPTSGPRSRSPRRAATASTASAPACSRS